MILVKIEKISDNQIRCTLNRADLQSRELKISELAYGTDKAKDLFHDMIEQASHEFGFKVDDLPLMIEAIPVSADCIILNITKVEDPEELDTRFSKFAPSDDALSNDNNEEDSFDFDDIFPESRIAAESNSTDDSSNDISSVIADNIMKLKDNFVPLLDSLAAIKSEADKIVTENVSQSESGPDKKDELPPEPISRMFSFPSLSATAEASRRVNGEYEGYSSLYKDPKKGLYYLLLTCTEADSTPFLMVCNEITEYGRKESMNFSTIAYLEEHCECIVRDRALLILNNI